MATSRNNELTWDLGWFALRGSDVDIERAGEMLRKAIDRIAADDIKVVPVAPGVSEIRYQKWSFRLKKDDLMTLLQELPNLKLKGIAQGRHVYEEVYSRAGSPDWVSVEFLKDYPSDDLPTYKWWDKDDLFELARNADGTYCIAAFYRWDEGVEIPSEIEGVAVTSIGDKAFYRNTHIKKLIIPDTVTSIGKSAFSGCSNLVVQSASPEIRAALEKAKVDVVSGNESEEDLEFKANYSYYKAKDGIVVTKYRGNAVEVTIPETVEGLPVVQIGKEAFDRGVRDPLQLTKITIPTSVVSIAPGAFFCRKLREIEFTPGSKLESIGDEAFSACRIEEIRLPDGLMSVGDQAFWGCPLKSVYVPASVDHIGIDAFGNEGPCAWLQPVYSWEDPDGPNPSLVLERIVVDERNESYTSVEGALYSKDLSKLIRVPVTVVGTYSIPESVVDIEAHAFEGCHIERVVIPATVQRIGDHAFMSCQELKEVIFGEGSVLEDIGELAFYECANLGECSIPSGVKRLAANVFGSCGSLRSFVIPASVKTVEESAFCDCGSLRDISAALGSKLESISERSFANSSALETVDLGHASKLTSVSASAFSNTWPYVVFPPSITAFEKWFGDGVIAQADVFAPGIACSAIRQIDYKKNCVAGFVRGMMGGGDAPQEIAKGYKTYIKGHSEEVLERFHYDLDVLKWLLGQKIFSTKDAGQLAQAMVENGLTEQAAVLLEYCDSVPKKSSTAGLGIGDDSSRAAGSKKPRASRKSSASGEANVSVEPLVADWLMKVKIEPKARKAITSGVALANGQGKSSPEALQLLVSLCCVPRSAARQCWGAYEPLDYLEPHARGYKSLPSGIIEVNYDTDEYQGIEWPKLTKPAGVGLALAEITSWLDPDDLSSCLESLYFSKQLDSALVALCCFGGESAIKKLTEVVPKWADSSDTSEKKDYLIADSALQHSRTKEAKRFLKYSPR